MNTAGLGRLSRTVIRLRPAQGWQRARLRTQRMLLGHSVPLAARWLLAGPEPASGQGWPAAFTPLDAGLWSDGQFRKALSAGDMETAHKVATGTDADGGGEWQSDEFGTAA